MIDYQSILTADIPGYVYHADDSLSASGAKLILDCPAVYRHFRNFGRPPKRFYDIGSMTHQAILGKGDEIAVLDPSIHGLKADGTQATNFRATKSWQKAETQARNDNKVPVTLDDWDSAKKMSDSVFDNPEAAKLLESGYAELSGWWDDPKTGVKLRFRPDWLTEQMGRPMIVDVKTAKSANPISFARDVAEYKYHCAVAWYIDGLAANGIPDADFRFIVVCTKPPHLTIVAEIPIDAIEEGRRLNRQAIDLYAECRATGHWPGYGDGVHLLNLPAYALPEPELELDF